MAVIDKAERLPLITAAVLMAVFLGAIVYAATRLNISVPTCVTNIAPFKTGSLLHKGNGHYEVHIVAKMWAFDPSEIRLPPGADVDIYLSALDVTHGMYIEHTNVNLMAVPGAVNAATVRFDKEGQYNVICHEYCGAGHHFMMAKFVIAPGPASIVAAAVGPPGGPVSRGQQLFAQRACDSCHSVDGSPGLGPTLKGLFGSTVELADGSKRVADDAYLTESIREPDDVIVKGYEKTMPEEPIGDDELKALVDYIKTLS